MFDIWDPYDPTKPYNNPWDSTIWTGETGGTTGDPLVLDTPDQAQMYKNLIAGMMLGQTSGAMLGHGPAMMTQLFGPAGSMGQGKRPQGNPKQLPLGTLKLPTLKV